MTTTAARPGINGPRVVAAAVICAAVVVPVGLVLRAVDLEGDSVFIGLAIVAGAYLTAGWLMGRPVASVALGALLAHLVLIAIVAVVGGVSWSSIPLGLAIAAVAAGAGASIRRTERPT